MLFMFPLCVGNMQKFRMQTDECNLRNDAAEWL